MPYEIDFIGIDEPSGNADAITFRWLDIESDNFKIGVYDGGTKILGEALKNHLDQYYFRDAYGKKVIDFVVCSHSDQDHASGLKIILENYIVRALYMNRPWLYLDYLYERRDDERITKASLEKRLKNKYNYIAELEELADQKGIPIHEVFQGTCIENMFYILSPSRQFYLDLLVESRKTPLEEGVSTNLLAGLGGILESLVSNFENWYVETLRENVSTSAENEMSIVLLGNMQEEGFLLTGDAGIRALGEAIDYSNLLGMPINRIIKLMQIPHHGGRHNVNPSILNKMLGDKVKKGETRDICAVASVAKENDHPRKMVVNAYLRRGARVYTTAGYTFNHGLYMPSRDGWSRAKKLTFSDYVEKW